ncbi:MAG TPA: hypothetical protein VIK27_11705, partial [Candidatus Aquilonibacter sp.]
RTVLVGDMTPLASARYLLGGSLDEYLRPVRLLENAQERMLGDALPLAALCDYEALTHHANAARMRHG